MGNGASWSGLLGEEEGSYEVDGSEKEAVNRSSRREGGDRRVIDERLEEDAMGQYQSGASEMLGAKCRSRIASLRLPRQSLLGASQRHSRLDRLAQLD